MSVNKDYVAIPYDKDCRKLYKGTNRLENRRQIRSAVWRLVESERQYQIAKNGLDESNTDYDFLAIAMEELGEVAQAILKNDGTSITDELIQAVAVLTAWLEKLMDHNDD